MVGRGGPASTHRGWKGVPTASTTGLWIHECRSRRLCRGPGALEIRKGDSVIFRTGHQERLPRQRAICDGGYCGRDGAGPVVRATAHWIKNHDIAAICARHLGLRGATERDRRGEPAPGTGCDPPRSASPWARSSTSRTWARNCAEVGPTSSSLRPAATHPGCGGLPIKPRRPSSEDGPVILWGRPQLPSTVQKGPLGARRVGPALRPPRGRWPPCGLPTNPCRSARWLLVGKVAGAERTRGKEGLGKPSHPAPPRAPSFPAIAPLGHALHRRPRGWEFGTSTFMPPFIGLFYSARPPVSRGAVRPARAEALERDLAAILSVMDEGPLPPTAGSRGRPSALPTSPSAPPLYRPLRHSPPALCTRGRAPPATGGARGAAPRLAEVDRHGYYSEVAPRLTRDPATLSLSPQPGFSPRTRRLAPPPVNTSKRKLLV